MTNKHYQLTPDPSPSFNSTLFIELKELTIELFLFSFRNRFAAAIFSSHSCSDISAVLFRVGVSSRGIVYPLVDKSGRLAGKGGNEDVEALDC